VLKCPFLKSQFPIEYRQFEQRETVLENERNDGGYIHGKVYICIVERQTESRVSDLPASIFVYSDCRFNWTDQDSFGTGKLYFISDLLCSDSWCFVRTAGNKGYEEKGSKVGFETGNRCNLSIYCKAWNQCRGESGNSTISGTSTNPSGVR
jgi:hypothetical protein